MEPPYLSIVIPAYNEADVIGSTLEAIGRYLAPGGLAHEILVVDDGSTDATPQLVRWRAAHYPQVRLLTFPHQGKGGAVRQGVLAAAGRYVLFLDADSSTRIEEWDKLHPWLQQGYDVVIGSRKIAGAQIARRQSSVREFLGKGFTWLTNALLSTRVTDITCGFKAFQHPAARELFGAQRLTGWGFDAEILFLAQRFGYRLKEVPVVWTNDATTNMRLGTDILRSFSELVAVRWHACRGRYARPPAVSTPAEESA